MSLQSTYHLRNSLPNRSPSQRPRSLSLSEYQPINFNREALEAAYQQTIGLPTASSVSSRSVPSWFGVSNGSSADTHDTSMTSLLSHELKAGDNPHGFPTPPPRPPVNVAGVGAGHALTPPHSPFHSAAKLHHNSMLSPVPGSPGGPPTPPPRPMALPESTYGLASAPHTGVGIRRAASAMDVDDGYSTDPGASSRARGKRKALPALPTDVPAPEPPVWEPDIKAHIPAELTQPSINNAYAQLSAPPPNLPPRRTQPLRRRSTRNMPNGRGIETRGQASAGPSSQVQPTASSSTAPLPSVSTFAPIADEPMSVDSTTSLPNARQTRPSAEKEVFLRATDKTPIWSTHYLDPCLRSSLNVPPQVTNAANVALRGLGSGQKTRYNSTIGAPIDGLARAAKDWVVPADAKFVSELGGIEVCVAVIDGGADGWGKEKSRKKARVEAFSKQGGIKVDVIELDGNRQIDLRIETKTGDVLVLLPDSFHGPIHVVSPLHRPQFLPILSPQLEPIANPYAAFYTTHVTPLQVRSNLAHNPSFEHRTASNIQRFTPQFMREQSGMGDQVVGGYMSHTRGEQSKVTVQSSKGRVVIGYRESADGEAARGMSLVVGAQGPQKKKRRWW